MKLERTFQSLPLALALGCGLAATAPTHGQLIPADVAKAIEDATGVDLNRVLEQDASPHDLSDAFNLYVLRKEDVVRTDNPSIKRPIDLDLIVDAPPVIDKRRFRTLQSEDYRPEEIFIRFKPGVTDARRAQIHAALGGEVIWRSAMVPGLCKVRLLDEVPVKVNDYLDENDVLYAEPDYSVKPDDGVFPNPDPDQSQCWGLLSEYGATKACHAWGEYTGGVVVAIIDTGVDIDHPDLVDNLWVNPDEIPGNGLDDDGNGKADDINGWNVADDNADVNTCGVDHGTHVAGTVGARGNNGIGVVGVSPFGKLMVLRCNGPGTCDPDGTGPEPTGPNPCCGLYNTIQAVDYAIANGARISNNSYGSSTYSQTAYDEIQSGQAVGHLFVASAGNGGADQIGDNNDVTPHYPDGYALANIISVAAVDNNANLGSFSNFGVTSVDIGAPGVNVYSTVEGGYEGGWNGTSMAAPHVAGVASLVTGRYPGLTWTQVKQRILDGTQYNSLSGLVSTGSHMTAFTALGVWLDPNWNGLLLGSIFSPFAESDLFTAYQTTPEHGTLNFKPGRITSLYVDYFLWEKPMELRATGGTIILGD